MENQLCLVCNCAATLPPHGVCKACYEHLKRNEIPPEEQVAASCKKRLLEAFPDASPETIENNIARSMKFHQDEWDGLTKNGLTAHDLAIIVIDEADHLPTWKVWHFRRIAFMGDLIAALPVSVFHPATREQLNRYTEIALAYWSGELSELDREKAYRELKAIIHKKTDPSTWDEKSLPLWMLQTQETFDWMWEQFMDCVHSCVPEKHDLPDTTWMQLLQKHFSDVLAQWVSAS